MPKVRYTGESQQVDVSRIGRDLESNAEYQRRKTQMTKDEKVIDARDRIAKNLHEQNVRDNKKTTFDEALRHCTKIAERAERIKSEGGET